jgi:glyoxylase-like metal-dependent hydrolase (beta-lactamase superfamily II)
VLGTEDQPALVRWSTWWNRPSNFDSYALLTAAGPVLVDPVEPAPDMADALWGRLGSRPVAAVLTNDMHERDAYAIRQRWDVPVWAPAAGLRERGGVFDGLPDHLYEDGASLPGGLRAIKVAGKFAGDTMLLWSSPTGQRVLFTGDAINGQVNPENPLPHPLRAAPGLYVGAGFFFLQDLDVAAFKASLRRVLEEDFDLICGAHGQPYHHGARDALTRLVALDWPPIIRSGRHPMV